MLPFMVTTSNIKKDLQLIQNKCLKIILNQPRTTSTTLIHDTLKVQKLESRLYCMTSNFLKKAMIDNTSIANIGQIHDAKNNTIKKSKQSILDQIDLDEYIPR
jgi:hypothetical protein